MESNMSVLKEFKKAFKESVEGSKPEELVKLSSPHFLYATSEQAISYEKATHGSPKYKDNLDFPISNLIRKNATKLTSGLSKSVHFIDLGPGYPSKSLILLEEFKKSNKITYYPVDVSPYFLDRAAWTASGRVITTHKQLTRFEYLGPIMDRELQTVESSRFVFLGLTFNNFEPEFILDILDGLVENNDRCLICCQSSSGISNSDLVAPYDTEAVEEFCFLPLQVLGMDRNCFDFEACFENNAIRVRFIVNRNIEYENIPLPEGLKIETSVSYRYETDEMESLISDYFDISETFVVDDLALYIYLLRGKNI